MGFPRGFGLAVSQRCVKQFLTPETNPLQRWPSARLMTPLGREAEVLSVGPASAVRIRERRSAAPRSALTPLRLGFPELVIEASATAKVAAAHCGLDEGEMADALMGRADHGGHSCLRLPAEGRLLAC